ALTAGGALPAGAGAATGAVCARSCPRATSGTHTSTPIVIVSTLAFRSDRSVMVVSPQARPADVSADPAASDSLRELLELLERRQWIPESQALVLEDFEVLLDAAVQRHADRPRPREHLRIFDRRLVLQMVRADRCVSFNDVQLVAVV